MAGRDFLSKYTLFWGPNIQKFRTSVELEPTKVSEHRSDSDSEFMENEDEELRDFPRITLTAIRSRR